MTMTGRDTLAQPQQITQAPVETTQTEVRPNWMAYLKCLFSVQRKAMM